MPTTQPDPEPVELDDIPDSPPEETPNEEVPQ